MFILRGYFHTILQNVEQIENATNKLREFQLLQSLTINLKLMIKKPQLFELLYGETKL